MAKELKLNTFADYVANARYIPLNDRQKRARAKEEKARKKRIADRTKEVRSMKYTSKERQAYLKALRYGRRQKAGGEFKAVPKVKFNGGSLGVMKDGNGVVRVIANHPEKGTVTVLGPRGPKDATNFSTVAVSTSHGSKAAKMIKSALASVSEGKYKLGSTGSRGG